MIDGLGAAVVVETERLRLRPLGVADAEWWVGLHADPEVNRFVGAYTLERAAERLALIEGQWAERGHGLCAIELVATGERIGRCGLNWWADYGETELGWTLASEHWGRGYATEAARGMLEWGFETLGLDLITAMIHHGNESSVAVARRLGFDRLREDEVLARPCTVYGLSRSAYLGAV
ncbi:N-acetyltransferase [Kitasatospora sp. MMS16-BH015]|uniref:GNAT family N-acetyltransferase n=1 Tax=Kitasatospora sp. MMS16-BH015 TaxID=2018025 RepID=UPI000CA16488|nr:GNAT family N-acetyltransferase [Kitasatospora sp. MMS16-BH015]AUG82194.1 N-acetyltransferase [Kitasatospora sp. MMS16-BH015]